MADIGRFNNLEITKHTGFGLYLDGGEDGEILLPNRYVPKDQSTEVGDRLRVFVYFDSEDRIIATTTRPRAQVGDFANLKVVARNRVGLFLDWGLPKDVLLPFAELKKPLEEGQYCVAYLYLDKHTSRVLATTRLDRYLDKTPARYKVGDAVNLLLVERTDLGYKAIINGEHWGLIHRNEAFRPIKLGRKEQGYIREIRPDGKINLSLQPVGTQAADLLQQQILDRLHASGGHLAMSDRSSPEAISDAFGVSKSNFKKAIGGLMKKGLVQIHAEHIELSADNADQGLTQLHTNRHQFFAALSPAVFIVPVYLAGNRRRPADDKDDVMTNWKVLSALLLGSALLSACNSDSDNDDDAATTPEQELAARLAAFPQDGVELPFAVLRDDLIDGKTMAPFEVRNGGYGSAMTAHPSNLGEFYAMTDRGPNADFVGGAYGSGKSFPVADYTPRIGHFRITASGGVEQLATIELKRPDGTLITGLPNTSALGGTGETPYNPDGTPIVVDPTQPYDAATNPIKLDDYGLDGEGLVALRDGSFWASDEYGPHMVHFDAEGREIDRINPFTADTRTRINLPAEYAYRRANRGMEGLAITPDESTLVGLMQSTMDLPDRTVRSLTITRIVTVNLQTDEIGQYLYRQELPANSNSEMVGLSATDFLVLERDGSFLYGGPNGAAGVTPDAQKQVYRIDLSTGTNLETVALLPGMVQDPDLGLTINGKTLEQVVLEGGWEALAAVGIYPVDKTLALDMVVAANYPHDKMEGLWRIDDSHLGVLNDDDFATWSTGGVLEQKMLDDATIDAGRLYIREVDLSVD